MTGPRRGELAAAGLLWFLLAEEGPYRNKWVAVARRDGLPVFVNEVNQTAVRRVITAWAEDNGELSEEELDKPRPMKDRIFRLASVQMLSPQTLRWFIEAFEIADHEADRLWLLLEGHNVDIPTLALPKLFPGPPPYESDEYETFALIEDHYLGPAGLPIRHVTKHGLVALGSGPTILPVRFDVNMICRFRVEEGGVVVGETRYIEGPVYEVYIRLDDGLPDERFVTYVSEYMDYPSRQLSLYGDDIPAKEFRRMLPKTTDTALISVHFDPKRLPNRVWWVIWKDLAVDGKILRKYETKLTKLHDDYAVAETAHHMPGLVVGFKWEW